MKKPLAKVFGPSWRTSLLGIVLIGLGVWAFILHWVPTQTVWFNLMYAEIAPIAIIACGVVAIWTREQRAHDKGE